MHFYLKTKKRGGRKSTICKINEKVIEYANERQVNSASWHDEVSFLRLCKLVCDLGNWYTNFTSLFIKITKYKKSSYIYIGGLDLGLTEGDIVTVFSQWGEPIDVNLIRDKKTGLSRGYCFLCYEDQRSTILAVDNANDMKLLGKTIKVDHVKDYNPNTSNYLNYKLSGPEGGGVGVYGITQDVKDKFNKELEVLKQMNLGNFSATSNKKCKEIDHDNLNTSNTDKLLPKSLCSYKKRARSLSRSLSQ
ncbi:hypothetical protein FG386_000995 [Cryptosporidium ryanae]|uniref:uncharacterized protein n=1 Tax=Cryptosporidium ryanae TaxID=515981 RepID=UPI00351A5526|nr:hypothetical protein FG386_000995 [Cryptosporidium ryanae]